MTLKECNLQNMLELVRLNEGPFLAASFWHPQERSFLTYFPAFKTLYEETKKALDSITAKIQTDYDKTIQIINSKVHIPVSYWLS